jgi:hypothetical protein
MWAVPFGVSLPRFRVKPIMAHPSVTETHTKQATDYEPRCSPVRGFLNIRFNCCSGAPRNLIISIYIPMENPDNYRTIV